ncbi:aspartyl protease family protein [Candidatus Bathyarchaeota archaeon]|nr:aspartyl protease family protein [Candidatus Bathyarchaeota archaeon]
MGFTYVKVRVYNPADMSKFDVIELLVDTGAIFTSIPRGVLERLGLKPLSRRRLRVYGGTVVERDVGVAVFEYEDSRAGAPVIFGEPEDTPLLGATSLEALGYQVDPITKRLKPTELLMI